MFVLAIAITLHKPQGLSVQKVEAAPVVQQTEVKPVVEQKQPAPAPIPEPKPEPQPAPQPVVVKAPVQVGVKNCGDNPYKQYIYMKESGCRTDAVNSIGCRGLGQACPGSKLPCSNSDFACQDAWFSNYAITRYGSWERAYQFWLANKWW